LAIAPALPDETLKTRSRADGSNCRQPDLLRQIGHRPGQQGETGCGRLFRDSLEFSSGPVDLVVSVRRHRGGGLIAADGVCHPMRWRVPSVFDEGTSAPFATSTAPSLAAVKDRYTDAILVSRIEAARLLSISAPRSTACAPVGDVVARRRGRRLFFPVAELQRYANTQAAGE